MGVGTYWAWETTKLRCGVLGGARRFGTHRGRRGARHIVAGARLQLVLFYLRTVQPTLLAMLLVTVFKQCVVIFRLVKKKVVN